MSTRPQRGWTAGDPGSRREWITADDPLSPDQPDPWLNETWRDGPRRPPGWAGRRRPGQWLPRWIKWGGVALLAGLLFRKALAWAAMTGLAAALHLIGLNVRLPHVALSWPWQSVAAGTTTDTDIGPWVLQKIEGISRPALGTGEPPRTGDSRPGWFSPASDHLSHGYLFC